MEKHTLAPLLKRLCMLVSQTHTGHMLKIINTATGLKHRHTINTHNSQRQDCRKLTPKDYGTNPALNVSYVTRLSSLKSKMRFYKGQTFLEEEKGQT